MKPSFWTSKDASKCIRLDLVQTCSYGSCRPIHDTYNDHVYFSVNGGDITVYDDDAQSAYATWRLFLKECSLLYP